MANDFLDDTDATEEDWSSFKSGPEAGDLKVLNDLIEQAAKVKEGIKKMEDRTNNGKALLRNYVENEIPEMMSRCGFKVGDFITYGGVKVELKSDTYCNVPSISAINDEKDDNRREELKARRETGLAILEEKAPTLIKRKYEITVDRSRPDQAECVKNLLTEMEDPPEWSEGLSVHSATLGKWIKELKSAGQAFTEEENWAFGIFPRKIVKITK